MNGQDLKYHLEDRVPAAENRAARQRRRYIFNRGVINVKTEFLLRSVVKAITKDHSTSVKEPIFDQYFIVIAFKQAIRHALFQAKENYNNVYVIHDLDYTQFYILSWPFLE